MLDYRPILFITGLLLMPLGLTMLIPSLVDWHYSNNDSYVFLASSGLTVFAALSLILANRGIGEELQIKQAFLLTTIAWVVLPAFAALPFMFSELSLSFTDAFFEAMSGLTTTGSTVMTGLDHAPPGIIMWRALLQGLGGIGIIVVAVAILPMLRIGGMQIFQMESSDRSDKILPRAAQVSGAIAIVYFALIGLCFVALMFAGMTPFESVAHSMTTIATGGFSTSDQSIGHFNSAAVDSIIIIFMILGSLPFVLYLQALRGRPMALWRDQQVQGLLLLIFSVTAVISVWLVFNNGFDVGYAIRMASFNVTSVITGTGFSSANYNLWGSFVVSILFMVMFIGGCAGSTSCGLKVFRLQVLLRSIKNQISKLNRPNGVFILKYNSRPLPDSVVSSVMGFLFLYMLTYVVISLALTLTGLDFISALSGAGTTLSNVGPGLGNIIGPAGNFQSLPESAKWILSFSMLLGRLELFTVLVLFTPTFWRA